MWKGNSMCGEFAHLFEGLVEYGIIVAMGSWFGIIRLYAF